MRMTSSSDLLFRVFVVVPPFFSSRFGWLWLALVGVFLVVRGVFGARC